MSETELNAAMLKAENRLNALLDDLWTEASLGQHTQSRNAIHAYLATLDRERSDTDDPWPIMARVEHPGHVLRRDRVAADYGLNEFAERIGFSGAYLSDVERGLRRLSISFALVVAQQPEMRAARWLLERQLAYDIASQRAAIDRAILTGKSDA